MGMTGQYRRIPGATLEQLLAHPDAVEEFLVPMVMTDSSAGSIPLPREALAILESMPAGQKEEMLARMQSMMGQAGALSEAMGKRGLAAKLSGEAGRGPDVPDTPAEPALDIDKAWHGLHFLMCGTVDEGAPPLGNVVLGGRPIGDDLGYGPCRYLTVQEVTETAAALSSLTTEQLKGRYDGAAMDAAEIYPGGWDDDENLEWLLEAFESVREYFRLAAASRDAMLLYLT